MARSKFWNFNLTEDDHEQILKFQGRVCALCGKNTNKKGEPLQLYIDHDHKTGLIRGALCMPCNSLVGERVSVEVFRKILEYLLNPPATQALGSPRFGLPGRVGTKKQRKLFKKMQKAKRHEENNRNSSNGADVVSNTGPNQFTK